MAEMTARLRLDASEYTAEMKRAGALGVAEAQRVAGATKDAADQGGRLSEGLGKFARFLGAGYVAMKGVQLASAGAALSMANLGLEAAAATGTAQDMAEAYKRQRQAIADAAQAVPVFGAGLALAFNLNAGIGQFDQIIQRMGVIEAGTRKISALNAQWAREADLALLAASGASGTDIAERKAKLVAEDRADAVKAAADQAKEARLVRQDAEDNLNRVQQRLDQAKKNKETAFGVGFVNPVKRAKAQWEWSADVKADYPAQLVLANKVFEEARRKEQAAAREAATLATNTALKNSADQAEIDAGINTAREKDTAETEQRITAFMQSEEDQRIADITDEAWKLTHIEGQSAEQRQAITARALARIDEIRQAARDKNLAAEQSALQREYSLVQREGNRRIAQAEQLQSRLASLTRSRTSAEEDWFERNVRMNMEGKSEAAQKVIAGRAGQAYVQHAQTARATGDSEEERRRLTKAMDWFQQAGDRRAMAGIMARIRESFDAEKTATQTQFNAAKKDLGVLSQTLAGIETRAASIKVDLDIEEAKSKLASLGIPTTIKRTYSWGGTEQGFAAGGWVAGDSGPDRVPAWLTRDEYVLNPRAAAANAAILPAMNRGLVVVPPYAAHFASGGPVGPTGAVSNDNRVFNVTVGPGASSNARQLAAAVLGEIRRLERRGH